MRLDASLSREARAHALLHAATRAHLAWIGRRLVAGGASAEDAIDIVRRLAETMAPRLDRLERELAAWLDAEPPGRMN